ncbi:hypothetical protein ACFL2A_01655 [Thermodesulfobacteriota bacterium]
MKSNDMKSRIVFIFELVAIFLLLVVLYCFFSGSNEYKIGKDALDGKDYKNATVHFSRAVSWYLPYASYVSDSLDNLLMIADQYEKAGQADEARYTYLITRGSLYSIRSTYYPKKEYLDIVNEKLATFSAKAVSSSESGEEYIKARDEAMAWLSDSDISNMRWTPIVSLAFLGWVITGLLLIMQLFKNNVVNSGRAVIIKVAVLITFYVIWLITMVKA